MTDLYWMIGLVLALVVGNLWLLQRGKRHQADQRRRGPKQ